MNLTRLMALGILARSGPSHGHHIRRVADVTNVGEWGGVSVGALYRELRAMEREGLVEAARTEKVGNRPERTVYAITAEGQLELTTLREQAIRPLGSGLDPLGVALLFAADGMDPEELRRNLRARREMLAIAVGQIAADREQLIAKGFLDLLAAAVMRRGIMTTEAEIRWHDELDAALAAAGEGATRGRIAGGPPLSLGEGAFDITADIAAQGLAASAAAAEEAGAAPGDGAAQDAGPDTGQDAGPDSAESR
ncbi:MAG TPA: PadR family transcriptional regulator [Trebonia sp.]|jgi:DNA-binding PadR family transcriptional regulator